MSGAISRLPLEVLTIILQHIPDLPSIYKFICASTRVNAAFEIDSANILDGAIVRSIPEFKHLARTVAILGSFSSSSKPTYDGFLREFRNLPKDVLTTAPASFSFLAGTPGIRYVLLTAYRIETLRHICFVTLLENIHELMWSMPCKNNYRLRTSRSGVFFQEAAWYPPSWVERIRVERALWKLVIYWNVCAICQDFRGDDYDFDRYSAKIWYVNPRLGPSIKSFTSYQHEVEEMRCVLSTTQELLGCTTRSFELFTPFSRQDYPKPCIKIGTCLKNLKETVPWKFQEPRPREDKLRYKSLYYGQERHCASEKNTKFRSEYWSIWRRKPTSTLDGHDRWFPDYLGLCIWDLKRLSYLGLATVYDKRLNMYEIDANQRTPCNTHFDCGGLIPERWRAVFLHELARSLGGRTGQLTENYYSLIIDWNTARLGAGYLIDGLRLYILRPIRR